MIVSLEMNKIKMNHFEIDSDELTERLASRPSSSFSSLVLLFFSEGRDKRGTDRSAI